MNFNRGGIKAREKVINLKKYNPDYYYPLLVLFISFLVFLPNLDRHHLWQDEAQTALISRSVLTNGIPLGHDGKNSFSQESGAEIDKDGVYKWHPWIPFYIHAGFFKLFGQSDFSARLPDALFGMGTVILCFLLMRSTGKGIRASLLAAGILMLMIPFLLLSRQCRYYSMVSFFSVGCIWAYFLFLQSKNYARILLITSTVILFHIQMIYGVIFIGAVLIHISFGKKELLKSGLISISIILCSVLPWIFYASDVSYQEHYGKILHTYYFSANFIYIYVLYLFKYIVPIYFLLYVLLVSIKQRKNLGKLWNKSKEYLVFYLLYFCLVIIVISITAPSTFFRYLVPILPICAIILAIIIELGFRSHLILGLLGLFLIIVHQPLLNYYYELTNEYKGPVEGLVNYLQQHSDPTDTVAISYSDMPIKWYTDLCVIGGLAGDNLEQSKNARWIIIRKHYHSDQDFIVKNHLELLVKSEKYHKIVLDYPDMPFENREDPENHLYRTNEMEDRIVIYERMK